jgi:hypothetical protein
MNTKVISSLKTRISTRFHLLFQGRWEKSPTMQHFGYVLGYHAEVSGNLTRAILSEAPFFNFVNPHPKIFSLKGEFLGDKAAMVEPILSIFEVSEVEAILDLYYDELGRTRPVEIAPKPMTDLFVELPSPGVGADASRLRAEAGRRVEQYRALYHEALKSGHSVGARLAASQVRKLRVFASATIKGDLVELAALPATADHGQFYLILKAGVVTFAVENHPSKAWEIFTFLVDLRESLRRNWAGFGETYFSLPRAVTSFFGPFQIESVGDHEKLAFHLTIQRR